MQEQQKPNQKSSINVVIGVAVGIILYMVLSRLL